jgi:hypothetical protein
MKRVVSLFVLVMVLVLGIAPFSAQAYLSAPVVEGGTGGGGDTGDPDGGDGGHPWGGEYSSPGIDAGKQTFSIVQVVTGNAVIDAFVNYLLSATITVNRPEQPARVNRTCVPKMKEEAAYRRSSKPALVGRDR